MDNEEFMNKMNNLAGYIKGLEFDIAGLMTISDYLLEVAIRSLDESTGGDKDIDAAREIVDKVRSSVLDRLAKDGWK